MRTGSPTPSGAYDLFGGPCVVVDLGTATTFDAISAAGEYLGGAITPGVAISLDALFANAAALRRVELVEPRSVIGKSTVESIQSGRPLRLRRPGRRPVPPLRGGAGRVHGGGHRRPRPSSSRPTAEEIEYVEPWLTLHGLRIIFERNAATIGALPRELIALVAGSADPARRFREQPRATRSSPPSPRPSRSPGRRGAIGTTRTK